jgi:hypothetical protein
VEGIIVKTLKVTTWNVEWADNTLKELDEQGDASVTTKAKKKKQAEQKIAAIRTQIAELDADILFVCEGPAGEARAKRYFTMVAPDHALVTRNDPEGRSYGITGQQWLWFLIRKSLVKDLQPSLVPIETWQSFTRDQSQERHEDGEWRVSMPTFIRDTKNKKIVEQGPHKLTSHRHHRHPQVLRFTYHDPIHGSLAVEIIGLHLKSKFVNQMDPALKWHKPAKGPNDEAPSYKDIVSAIETSPGYMVASVQARAKLTTEASDVRYYIERRFAQEQDPAIFIVGDINDGPGKELIEEWFMLHDLIGSLQGDIFEAKSFLNHALFDFANDLRWSVKFEDSVDARRDPHILIDHIMFTQRMSGAGKGVLRVMSKAGLVEHVIHERVASLLPKGVTTSDHRPVSVTITAVDSMGNPLV